MIKAFSSTSLSFRTTRDVQKKSDQRLMTQKQLIYIHETRTSLQSLLPCTLCTTKTISANQWRPCGGHSGEYFSALNLQLSWGPAYVTTSLQPACPSEESIAISHMWWGVDCHCVRQVGQDLHVLFFKLLNYCPCFVGTGIIVVDEDMLCTGAWMLIFHLLDNFQ